MKKTLFAIATFAVLAMSCVKEQQPSTPADSAVVTSLRVSVADTKVSVNEATGACTWQEGDQIAVWYDDPNSEETKDGQKVVFTYKGLLDDGTAEFTTAETIPEGYVATKVAHPVGSINSTGGFSHVRDYIYDASRIPIYVRTETVVTNPDGSLSAQLNHNATIMQFELRDIPAYAAGFVVKTSGDIKIKTSFPYKTGYSENIVLNTAVPHSRQVDSFYLIDGDGDVIEGTVKTFKNKPTTVKGEFIKMGLVDFQKANLRTDYVKVCGIRWAKGNLQCIQNEGDATFQNGWRIAPTQWHHLTYTDNKETATAYTYDNNGTRFEHFNYGGIARQARFVSNGNPLTPTVDGLDISGKMYSDITATTEVTGAGAFKEIDTFTSEGNHNELWGDVAYWASKGQYKMPTAADMKKLHNEVHKIAGVYTTPDGKKVWGELFTTILPGESRKTITAAIELTDADLESGLFLPKGGRRYNKDSSSLINAVSTQGTYRTSTYLKVMSGYHIAAYYHIDAGNGAKLYDNGVAGGSAANSAYGATAGYLIRPILAD